MSDAAIKEQIRRIHVLKSRLKLDEEDYRAFLSGNFDVESSKELSYRGASEAIKMLEAQLPKSRRGEMPRSVAEFGRGGAKYESLGRRPGMATPAQLRMIEAMWAEVSVFRDAKRREAALENFLRSKFQRMNVVNIEAELVERIVKALRAMKNQKKKGEVKNVR